MTRLDPPGGAAMEPCPYRQGELAVLKEDGVPQPLPQWSPALIGRESPRAGEIDLIVAKAAMEPCPYRQGESAETLAHFTGISVPQWSPALIGRESRHSLIESSSG